MGTSWHERRPLPGLRPNSTAHLFFGHHGGILESRDGGRTWRPLTVQADAMGLRTAADNSIVMAGHDVLIASRDGGTSWTSLPADLPNLDIHGFARDPADPARMWAYLAEGGVYESRDGGSRWSKVLDAHVPLLTAYRRGASTALLGIDPFRGLVESADGAQTWSFLSAPPSAPIFSLAASLDAHIVFVGTPDGLLRSDDGGRTWTPTALRAPSFAIALAPDGTTVALVTQATDFYRSPDGGRSWPGP